MGLSVAQLSSRDRFSLSSGLSQRPAHTAGDNKDEPPPMDITLWRECVFIYLMIAKHHTHDHPHTLTQTQHYNYSSDKSWQSDTNREYHSPFNDRYWGII